MKARIFVMFVVAVLFGAVVLSSQQAKVKAVKADAPAKANASAEVKAGTADTPTAKPAAARPAQIEPAEADRAYKANCSRCHLAPRKFPERKMATVMQHMRVRANMTERETQAVLQYLTR